MAEPVRRSKKSGPGAIALVAMLGLVTVIVMIIGNKYFVIKQIKVEGTRYCSDQEVIQSAGLSYGDSIFSVDLKKVESGINSNRYLEFIGLWKDYPSGIVLTVSEHSPHATLMWMGMLVMLDQNGNVLEHTSQIDIMQHMPIITGAQVESVRVGYPIMLATAGQFDAMQAILGELGLQGFLTEISELNVAVLDNLYLVTEDGLQIMLGNSSLLAEKIALAHTALTSLRGMVSEVRGGMLDVSAGGESADFRPPVQRETPSIEK